MPTIEQSVLIQRPLREVFAAVTEVGAAPTWISIITDINDISGDVPAIGSTFREISTFMGKRIETQKVVTEYLPDELFVHKSTRGPIPQELSLRTEPEETGTLLTLRFEADTGGFFGALPAQLLTTAMEVIITGNLNRLKTLLESGTWRSGRG